MLSPAQIDVTIDFLVKNDIDSLENHQGEDVSLGIWIDENEILRRNSELLTSGFKLLKT